MWRLRRIIPLVSGLIFLTGFGALLFLYLKTAGQAAFQRNAPVICAAALIVYLTGTICGVWLDSRIYKKLPPERYRRLVHLIAAVLILLVVLCALGEIFLWGR